MTNKSTVQISDYSIQSANMNNNSLHICFIPAMAPGHMIPMIDLARQFARRGVNSTIITTPLNASLFSEVIERDRESGLPIAISLVDFPSREAGLPDGCENLASTTSMEMLINFIKALDLLRQPIENLLHEAMPDCIIAGAFFWWATDVARELNIPRFVFDGTGFFSMCVLSSLKQHEPDKSVESDSEEFVIPGLPDKVKLSTRQLPNSYKDKDKSPLAETIKRMDEAKSASYGIIVNSFYELEPAYVRHYMEFGGSKTWHVGPVSLFNKTIEEKAQRGKNLSDHQGCMNWLDSKTLDSVVYVCFGSMAMFSTAQLLEIAVGLEQSGREFIWVVGEKLKDDQDWLPEGFERRIQGRGLIIRGWAPQVVILEHEAVGGFVTHCGWNSVLEGVAAGVPMVTWPLSAEQFLNEKLVTEVLKTGIPVGAEECSRRVDKKVIKGEMVRKAVDVLMEGDDMRNRADKLRDLAGKAVEGGSSDTDLNSLLDELTAHKSMSVSTGY